MTLKLEPEAHRALAGQNGLGTPVSEMHSDLSFRTFGSDGTGQLPKPLIACIDLLRGATWRSGYATVCKTVYSGSIPDVASTLPRLHPLKIEIYSFKQPVKGLLTLWLHCSLVFP